MARAPTPRKTAQTPIERIISRRNTAQRKLSDAAQYFVVSRLAIYEPASKIAREVLDLYKIEIHPDSIRNYDPTDRGMKVGVAKHLQELFWRVREEFHAQTEDIPISQKSFRLKRLNDILQQEIERGNTRGARETLEQAAKEMGEVFTNRQKVEVGGPGEFDDLSDEELLLEVEKITTNIGNIYPKKR